MLRAEAAAARPGAFVTLEGVDGAGKTTQVVRLAERLEACGREVVRLRGVHPDVTLVLDMDPGLAFERAGARGEHDRMEAEGLAFQRRVREDYRQLAEAEPARVRLVDAAGAPNEVYARLEETLAAVLPGLFEGVAAQENNHG